VEKWYGFIGWCGHWQWTRVRSNLYLGWPAVCTLLGEEQCGQCTRGKRNLYLGWPAVCTLLGEEQCGQWTRGKRNLYLGWPAVCWLAQIYWVNKRKEKSLPGLTWSCCLLSSRWYWSHPEKTTKYLRLEKIKQKRHHDAAEHSLVYVFLVSPPY